MNLRLLQLADSAFPSGAYAFSDGLETLTTRGEVRPQLGPAGRARLRSGVESDAG